MSINYQKTYDTLSYEEKADFQNLAIKVISEIYPHYKVNAVEPMNVDAIYITNQDDNVRIQFPLRELFSHLKGTPPGKTVLKEIILKAYAEMFKTIEDTEYFMNLTEPEWEDVKKFVQPRFNRVSEIPEPIEKYVQTPFGEGVFTIYSIFSPSEKLNTRITYEMLEKWGITFEEMFQQAMENFAVMADGFEIVGTAKPKAMLWNEKGYEYSATCILLGYIRQLIAETIGTPYRFGIPSGYVLYCWSELDNEEFQLEMKATVEREYERLPNRLSTNIYEVDENGQMKQLKNLPETPQKPGISNN